MKKIVYEVTEENAHLVAKMLLKYAREEETLNEDQYLTIEEVSTLIGYKKLPFMVWSKRTKSLITKKESCSFLNQKLWRGLRAVRKPHLRILKEKRTHIFLTIFFKMTGYERTRNWFNFCFEHPDKVRPIHHAVYLYCLDLCNRLGWKQKFGLPTDSTMEVLGIKNYKTFIKALNEIIAWGFIILIQKSKNQYTANVIALSKNAKATTKALDKAILWQDQSLVSIDKLINNETLNNETLLKVKASDVPVHLKEYFKLAQKFQKVICKNLQERGAPFLSRRMQTFKVV